MYHKEAESKAIGREAFAGDGGQAAESMDILVSKDIRVPSEDDD